MSLNKRGGTPLVVKSRKIKMVVGVIAFAIPMMIQGKTPESIRIGLESVYKDASVIQIKSEEPLAIGYFEEEKWIKEGYLEAHEVNVSLASEAYYSYEEVYRNFEEASDALQVYDAEAVVAYIEPNVYKIYTTDDFVGEDFVTNTGKRIVIKDTQGEVLLISENDKQPLGFRGSYGAYDFPVTGVGSRQYRGVIEVVKGQSKGLTAVNQVDMEDYLYGVVPCEVSASWHQEALKAQAVAARSMATFQYTRFVSRGYNLVDTTTSQVYRGLTAEHINTTQAVDATSGQIVTYNGKVAETLYCASSGGYTADAKYVWGNAVPYLVAKADPYEVNHYPWTRKITLKEIEKCLANLGKNIGTVKGVRINDYSQSGRVNSLTILGSSGEYTVTNENTRTFFSGTNEGSLKSRMYQFIPYTQEPGSSGTIITKPETSQTSVTVLTSEGSVDLDLEGLWIETDTAYSKVRDTVYIQTEKELISSDEIIDSTDKTDTIISGTNTPQGTPMTVYGDLTIYGYGYGHGVGMSQYGAKGMAEAGFTYDEILTYYYEGTTIQ